MATTIHTFVTLLYTFVRDILSLLFCYGRPLETLWSGGGELLSHKDFFFCYQCAVMKIFLQNVVHEYLLSLIKKKKSFLAMQEYFSGLLSTHEIFHSIFLCMNNFFVLKKLLTSCPVRYKIHSLSLWASYCCLSNDPGWGGNKNDSVSISCSGTMTFNTHFFATERHCSRAWYGDWIILRFSVNHNIYICGIFLPCHFQRQEPMKGIL